LPIHVGHAHDQRLTPFGIEQKFIGVQWRISRTAAQPPAKRHGNAGDPYKPEVTPQAVAAFEAGRRLLAGWAPGGMISNAVIQNAAEMERPAPD